MKELRACLVGLLVVAGVAAVLYAETALAGTCEKWAGKVVSAQGTVQVKRGGQTQWEPVRLNETYCPGDTIRTERKSRADIALYNHPVLRLDQNTTVTLGGMKDEKTSLVDLIKGAAFFFSRVSRNLEVRTAAVNAGVEGTEFFLKAEDGKTDLSTFEGKVLASNAAGSLAVITGQSAVAEAGKAPVHRVVVRPRDAVRWALYYPPVIDFRPADRKEGSDDPRSFIDRASLLLAAGRVDEAGADIDRALGDNPKNSDALALRSIIAVVHNEKGNALDFARKSVEADPTSATARIALSYALQADFQLEGARNSLNDAVTLGPENALAWARLAEIRQSFGELDGSLAAARRAVALNPDLSRTQTVLGFAYLTQVKTEASKEAFSKAIELDSADPLPRLGLGLSKIREGNLVEGRRELEVAASLDPDSSILRSYLGKAYFEEKREKLAMTQFDMAKNLDPLDPTPYFYDAIQKQTVNRPVEALRDMQRAIELNDNRAVYRSRLLLDEDLAARSASLGRIYSDLGFQQRALVEGWRSLNFDPANHSAHRFLSDTYSSLPRHEIARVSELLQSQLLQPMNINPVQPRLAESNLLIVAGGGPGDLSFNEFNPLFNRDRVALQANGIVGENGTKGEEVVVSGLYRKASISVGQFHNETDGFRVNNDVRDDVYNAFLQVSLSPKTSLQAEYRHRKFEIGDIELRFFEDFSPNLRQNDKSDSIRLGFHHVFSPGSDLIGSFLHQKKEAILKDQFPIGIENFFDVKSDQKASGGELQYLHKMKSINLVGGAGYFRINGEDTSDFLIIDPDLGPIAFPTEIADIDTNHLNVYVYTHFQFLKNLTITAGASFDKVQNDQSDTFDKSQFNPKLGITWNPLPGTTLRAAVFRALKRTLITNQTLEPTQVAGFNQFFDDVNSTESWRYGAAVDQKIGATSYGGLEVSQRDLKIPTPVGGVFPSDRFDGKEKTGRAYLYGTPHEWLALSGEYLYERFERDERSSNAKTLETHRFPLAINVFHPSGLSATFKATYFDQKGSFLPQGLDPLPENLVPGKDTFWLCDAAIGYRLPQRFGIVTVGAKNLFDKSFRFFDTDPLNPAIQPARMFFARVTLSI